MAFVFTFTTQSHYFHALLNRSFKNAVITSRYYRGFIKLNKVLWMSTNARTDYNWQVSFAFSTCLAKSRVRWWWGTRGIFFSCTTFGKGKVLSCWRSVERMLIIVSVSVLRRCLYYSEAICQVWVTAGHVDGSYSFLCVFITTNALLQNL